MMEQLFSYIIGLGAAVMMPILFTLLGVCIGIRLGDALKAGFEGGSLDFASSPLAWLIFQSTEGAGWIGVLLVVCVTLLLLVWNRRLIVRQQQHNTLK